MHDSLSLKIPCLVYIFSRMSNNIEEQPANDFYAMGNNVDNNSSLNVFDSIALGRSNSNTQDYGWSNSSFCSASIQVKSKKNDGLSLNN